MKSEIADIEVLRFGFVTEHKDLHIVESIGLPIGPDETNTGRWLFVVHRVRVIDVELLDITERLNKIDPVGLLGYIVNYKNTGDSSQLHQHEICRQRYRSRDEWVEKIAGVAP